MQHLSGKLVIHPSGNTGKFTVWLNEEYICEVDGIEMHYSGHKDPVNLVVNIRKEMISEIPRTEPFNGAMKKWIRNAAQEIITENGALSARDIRKKLFEKNGKEIENLSVVRLGSLLSGHFGNTRKPNHHSPPLWDVKR